MNKEPCCPECGKIISKFAFTRHVRACKDGRIRPILDASPVLPNGKTQRWLDSMNSRKGNGSNQYTKAERLNDPKPIVSDSTKEKISEGVKQSSKNSWTPERRKKMSDHAKRRQIGGKFINSRCSYNGIKFGSSYEVTVAKSLDVNCIEWTKCKSFSYIDPFGKTRRYTADFYLPKFDVYLDPKNDFLISEINPSLGFNDLEKISIVQNTHSVKIIVLDKNSLDWQSIKSLIMLECPELVKGPSL